MASKVAVPLFFRGIVSRNYASQAATAAMAQHTSHPYQGSEANMTSLPSGAVVVSCENNSPISQIAVLFKAGSRYETPDSTGITHMLRICAGLGTKHSTSFNLTRSIQQFGGSLVAESGREHFMYKLEVNRDNLEEGLNLLSEVSYHNEFKPWELSAQVGRIKAELASVSSATATLELAHSAAFRNTGLANSLYMPLYKIGKFHCEQLAPFVVNTHTLSRMAVVGMGIDHDALLEYVKSMGIKSGEGPSGASVYGGGDIRKETGSSHVDIAIVGAGAKWGSTDCSALCIAEHILGTNPGVKYGSNASNKLVSLLSSSGCSGMATALNINYSDNGLFGYFISTDAKSAYKALNAVHNGLKSLKITENEVENAKKKAKAAIHLALDSKSKTLEDIGVQAVLTGKYDCPYTLSQSIDAVNAAAVKTALGKVLSGKLSLAAVGGVYNVPYLDQI